MANTTVLEARPNVTIIEVLDDEVSLIASEPEVRILTVGIQGPRGPSSIDRITNEAPAGAIDGSNAKFQTEFDFIPESVEVYVNGIFQSRVLDFNTSDTRMIILTESPGEGEVVLTNYLKG